MNNLLVFPLIIPLLTAVALIFGHNRIMLQRWISLVGSLIHLVVSCLIVRQVHHDGIQTLYMGGWLPPYGIIFVADMFAALLVLSTSVVSLACLLYAFRTIGQDRERYYFYPFFQFLIVGVCGSFLTGDLFNLFVCFEVMLIASYALIVLGGTKRQLRETLKYILINIVSSALFVAAVAYLYSVTGTLNMAHLSVRIAELEQAGILTVIAVMLLTVFALKAGLLLFFWLPGSYSAPPAAVRAVFAALLTKVGLYAIVRTVTLLFPYQPDLIRDGIGLMAMATMVLGGIGAVAYTNIHKIINYNVILGIGFIGFGIAVGNHASMDGVIFYLLHDMLAKALLFLLGGMLIKAAGTEDLREMGGLIKRYPLLGWLFFIVTLALVGVPPLSGFPGKMLMLRGGLESGNVLLTAVAVLSSLLVLYSLIRVFIGAFLGEEKRSEIGEESFKGLLAITFGLLVLLVGMGLGAEEIYAFVSQAGRILVTPELYVEAVLKR
ncbi:Na+/H+ antiporter subunit D [Paenibacillus sp. MB22_1]|uniref:Na+/H+ antiporter subunit D n=1 Tax=unclassified Paenibacillus TaxID=185978 RepID=UPI0001AFCE30|nr:MULTISPECIES: Na+/H+ antiporter subunit D [unclassified Paenibacillus]EES73238.1 Na(+)/H(+) antiporter subunit D [Paenibacillus sp. oral taxon 786 str. D14]MCT2197227.1 Na+/H+ antiporter subunit D [Paenibacillus sp. p3-SID1389]